MNRGLEALDLHVPKAKAVSGAPKIEKAIGPLVKGESPFNNNEIGPRLDTARIGQRRSKLSKHRREAKSRRYGGSENVLKETRTPPTFGSSPSTRLEIRVHSGSTTQQEEQVSQHKSRAWGQSNQRKQNRRTMSMPAVKQSRFVVVEEEVDTSDAPVCGIDLGPFLSWLSCMPVIPEASGTEEDDDS